MEADKSKGNIILVSVLGVIGHLFLIILLLLQLFFIYASIILVLSADGIINQGLMAIITLFLTFGALHILRAIFISTRTEERGVELSMDAPLWQETKALCNLIECPVPEKIYIVEDFNAYAGVERGILPWSHKPFVSIGLPLAATLNPYELKAVLAHELGHHSKKHSTMSSWIYRVRMSWNGIDYALNNMPEFVGKIAGYFYGWYIPLFQRKSFAISRKCEYEADEIAAKTTGATHIISALCRMDIAAEKIYNHFWPKINQLTVKSNKPPKNIFFHLIKNLKQINESEYELGFKAIDLEKTKSHDTHPCIKDRAQSLQQAIMCPKPNSVTALQLLGKDVKQICQQLSHEWYLEAEPSWQLAFDEEQEYTEQLKQHLDAYKKQELSISEIRDLAMMFNHRKMYKHAFTISRDLYQKTQTSLDKIIMAYHLCHISEQQIKAKKIAQSFLGQNPVLDNIALSILLEIEIDPAKKHHLQQERESIADYLEEMTTYNEKLLGFIEKPRKMYPPEMEQHDKNHLIQIFESIPAIKKVTLVEFSRHPRYPDCPNYLLMFENTFSSNTEQIEDELHDRIWLSKGVYSLEPFDDYMTMYLYTAKVKNSLLYKSS